MPRTKKKSPRKPKAKPYTERDRSNLTIGLTGPFGSGCSTMAKVLEDRGFQLFKISDDIRQEVQNRGAFVLKGNAGWRKTLQDHGNNRRKQDRTYWVQKVIERIDDSDVKGKNIVIDGLRNFHEVQEFRRLYPGFFLVAICAEKGKRWERVQKDYKGNYKEFEKDDRRDKSEDFCWGQSVQKCVDEADYVYYNDKNYFVRPQGQVEPDLTKINRKLNKQSEDFVPLMERKGTLRSPTPEEIQIAVAYAQSNSSTCEKRHVGAVITIARDGHQFPISMGFNENPPNVSTCLSEGACYKDEDMKSKLIARGKNIYCPSCGQHHKNLREPWICSNKECEANLSNWLYPNRNMELCTAIHAEERAILSLGGRSAEGGTLYVTTFPCFQCARLILDADIRKIVFVEAYPTAETTAFLKESGVDVQPFTGFTARAFFRVFPKVN